MPKPWEGPYFPYFGGQCLFMDHQNRNRDPLSVFPWWSAKTMRGSLFPLFPLRVKCQNHERVPISPISSKGQVPKPWQGPCFPYFPYFVKTWTTLSMFSFGEVPKAWEGPYFPYPLFSGPIFSSCPDMGHQNRGNRGNRDPLMVLALHP